MSLYSKDRFCQVSLPSELFCGVCSNVLCKPVNCLHCKAFKCEDCLEERIQGDHSFEKNENLKKKIDEFLIKCRNYQHGCQKILRISQISQHENEDCEYSKLKCDSKECEELSKNSEIRHMNTCGFYMIKCELCFKEMKLQEKSRHNCIEWLNSVVENLQFRNNFLSEERETIIKSNGFLAESQESERSQISSVLSELKSKNSLMNGEKERLQKDLELEIKTFDQQIFQKLQAFQSDSSYHLDDFHRKTDLDYEKHMSIVGDLMKNYLNNVNNNLNNLNGNIEKENKVLEKVSEEDVKIMKEKSPLKVGKSPLKVVNTPKKKENVKKSQNNTSEKKEKK